MDVRAHVYSVLGIADFQVRVDPVFVDVTDDGHVWNSIFGPCAVREQPWTVQNGHSPAIPKTPSSKMG